MTSMIAGVRDEEICLREEHVIIIKVRSEKVLVKTFFAARRVGWGEKDFADILAIAQNNDPRYKLQIKLHKLQIASEKLQIASESKWVKPLYYDIVP